MTLWTVACQAPLSMGILQARIWSGLPCLLPGDLLDPGIEPVSPASPALAGEFFTIVPPGMPIEVARQVINIEITQNQFLQRLWL